MIQDRLKNDGQIKNEFKLEFAKIKDKELNLFDLKSIS